MAAPAKWKIFFGWQERLNAAIAALLRGKPAAVRREKIHFAA